MQWPVFFSTALVAALCHYDYAHRDSLAILIITGILVAGLLRGCNAWQRALDEYQHRRARARHREQDEARRGAIPGCFPTTRRY